MDIARGAALADFNLDGLLDLVVVNRGSKAQIWRNTTPDAGGWLQLKLHQDTANTDAIGAWIEVRRGEAVARREILAGGGHASGQNGWWHFGLGADGTAEVRVIWPDGSTGDWQPVAANSRYILSPAAPPQEWVAP